MPHTLSLQIDLPKLNAEKRLQLVLVDHNRLAAHQGAFLFFLFFFR